MEQRNLTGYPSIDKPSIRDNFDDLYYPPNVTELITKDVDQKMIDLIRSANRNYMDTIVLRYMGLQFTYREFFDRVEEYARALKQFGLNKGDYITICLPNSPETVFYFYACNEIGVTPYLIDPRFTVGKMAVCIADSKSKLFICEMGTYYSKVAAREDQLAVDRIVVVSPLSSFEGRKLSAKQFIIKKLYGMKMAKQQKKAPCSEKRCFHKDFIKAGKQYSGEIRSEYDPSIPAIIVNTSGTSGDSVKGAVHSNRSFNVFMHQIDILFRQIERNDSIYGYIPFFSMYGSSTIMHGALYKGAILDLIPTFSGLKSIKDFLKKKSNIVIGVPTLYDKMIDLCVKKHTDMRFAKMYVIGGDNIAPKKLETNNITLFSLGMEHKLVFGYGATEVMMISTTCDNEKTHLFGSSGVLYPGAKVRVVDPDNGISLSYREEGEIYVHTETMMTGYLNKPEENKTVFKEIDGIKYFCTGDKGYLVETGHLFLTGRYKRLMKRPDGHQVSPIPIENSIAKQPEIEDCCVVGLRRNENDSGVIPTTFLQFRKDVIVDEKLIAKIAEESLRQLSGEREAALAFIVIDKIPYTENGKMDYRNLEAKGFPEGKLYVVDDPITRPYFKGMPNAVTIKIGQ